MLSRSNGQSGSVQRSGCILTKVMGRSALSVSALHGPMIVSEFDTTIVVPPDFQVTRDRWFNIVLAEYGSSVADAANKSAALTPTM